MSETSESERPSQAARIIAHSTENVPPGHGPNASDTGAQNETSACSQLRQERTLFEKLNVTIQATLALVGIGGLLIYGCQLGAMNAQICEMKKAADFSHQQLEVSERPWVSVKVTAGSDLDLRPGGGVTLNFTLHNSGLNPAFNVFFIPMPQFRIGTPNGNKEADDLCQSIMPRDPNMGFGRSTIFPSSESTGTARIDFATDRTLPDFDKSLYPYIVGCVTYKAPLNPGVWHYTEVIAEMEELSSDGHVISLKQGSVVPAKKLVFNDVFYNQKAN